MAEDWAAWATEIDAVVGPEQYGQLGAIRPEVGSDIPARFVVSNYDQDERDGELIQFADRKVYLSTVGISTAPTINDRLVIGSTAYRIVTVEVISPADIVICYVLQVR